MGRREDNQSRRVVWFTGTIIAVLSVFAGFGWLTLSRELAHARDSQLEVQRTREIIEAMHQLVSTIQSAANAERGFVITGQEAFLERYYVATNSRDELLDRLNGLIKDDQAKQIHGQIVQRSHELMALLQRVVAFRRAGDVEGASRIVSEGLGKSLMDDFLALVARLEARQKHLLDARLEKFRTSSYRSERISQLCLAGAVFLIFLASVLVARNYQRRLVAEAAHRDQATRLGATLDNIDEAIVTINESGGIDSWSKGAEATFGYAAEEVLRRNVSMLMPEPHASAHDGYLRRYIATGDKRLVGMRRELEAKHKDGHRFPVELAVSEMRLGQRRLFIGSMRDISARLEMERLKSGFVATVSHELRTPLTSIAGSLGLLAVGSAGALSEKGQKLVDIALSNSKRLIRLINDILDVEKAEAGKMEFDLKPLRIGMVVQQAIDMNRGYAQSLGVVIEPDAASEDATVLVDRDRLIQVLTNLLSNAAKFSPREATVAVRIRTEPDSVRVEVRDQGPGIAPEFQKRIFQKFAQGDCTDSRQKDGTGLGLSISKTLIEQLGGSIGFSSEPGKGATFFFTLPRHRVPVRDAASSNGKFAGHRVLLCEDDPDVAEGLHALLTSSGIRVELASSAQAARAVLEKERVDMAVIDVDLPDADGIEFIAELRSRLATRNLPIVVSTAHARASIAEQRLAELNVTHWLEKSGDPQQLAEAIHESLANARLARAAVLYVEDDESLTEVVQEAIGDQFDIVTAHTLAEARERLRERQYDALILDIGLADGSGLDLLPEISGQNGRPTPVVLYSATEVSKELATKVELALVKSRHSVTQVLRALRKLAA